MNKLFFKATLVLGIALSLAACTKETEAPVATATTGSVNLELDQVIFLWSGRFLGINLS